MRLEQYWGAFYACHAAEAARGAPAQYRVAGSNMAAAKVFPAAAEL